MKENKVKQIVEKLEEIKGLLEESMEASNMDVEFLCQEVESMIEEFNEVGEFRFEEIED